MARRGRKRNPLPSPDIINQQDLIDLSSMRLSKRIRVFEKVYQSCGYSLSTTARFFREYFPQFYIDRKTLRRYLDSFYYAQKLSNKFNGILTEEEICRYLYILARRKLQRSIVEPLTLERDDLE